MIMLANQNALITNKSYVVVTEAFYVHVICGTKFKYTFKIANKLLPCHLIICYV